jgi:hypothetical protein
MEPEELESRRFSRDEVGELIESATRLGQLRHEGRGLSVDELRRMALELGISDEALLAAVHERTEQDRSAAAGWGVGLAIDTATVPFGVEEHE